MESPLHQFVVEKFFSLNLFGIDISVTNVTIWLMIIVLLSGLFMTVATKEESLIPNKLQSLVEIGYIFVADLLKKSTSISGMQYFPFVFTIFIFVLISNMIGLLPTAFTVTSQFAVTATMALLVMISITVIGFIRNGSSFLHHFLPSGVPIWLAPLLVLIEIISYMTRPVSLSIRLFANMMAGHTALKVFASLVVSFGFFGIAPLFFTVAMLALETFVAFLQAYIFTVLTCVYLNDALHPHH